MSRRWVALALSLAVMVSLVPHRPDEGGRLLAATTTAPRVIVYGGTPAGILAAVTSARAGRDVVLIEPTRHVGGMMTSGLGWTDTGDRATIGGYTREFFNRVQTAEGSLEGRYHFEPSVAERVFEAMLVHPRIVVVRNDRLAETGGVTVVNRRITSIRLVSGRVIAGTVFVDATYEGDLMADAGVSYRIGRESTTALFESEAGVRPAGVIATLPAGFDPGFPLSAPGALGTADKRIQASNYRICFSSNPTNRVPFPLPAGYDAADHEVLLHVINARLAANPGITPTVGWFLTISPLVNKKFDVNDFGSMSTAIPGLNYPYPDATYAQRASIDAAHRTYDQGFIWFLANDPRVPQAIRTQMAGYGLCKDEFVDNGNWPRLLYLREGRRMEGAYMVRQRDIDRWRSKTDAIGIASYRRDSHFVSRWIDSSNRLRAEGSLSPHVRVRWDIPYRSLTPKATQILNLLVPVTASASHVAMSSLRMEPQYMIMGEAAGQAAAMVAGVAGGTVQGVDVQVLQNLLRGHGAYIADRAR
jgi:hypothetical protein